MCRKELPSDYVFLDKIDLQKNKKQFWLVNGLSAAICLITFGVGIAIVPLNELKSAFYEKEAWQNLLYLLALAGSMVLYIILHELTHGVFLYSFTKVKLKFGFIGWAAYCGNDAYVDKKRYVVVALAPVVVWGIIFGVLNFVFKSPMEFWLIWLLQTVNLSGAAGDMFVSLKMLEYPRDILVRDVGVSMSVYRRKTEDELRSEAQEKLSENNND